MESENLENIPSQAEEEPQVFSVVRDSSGNHFTRRNFIEKSAVAVAAVMAVSTGCVLPGSGTTNIQATIDNAISATENAAKLTEIAGNDAAGEAGATDILEPATSTPVPPTETPAPTETMMPTETLTPTQEVVGIKTTISGNNVNFRSGPGTGYNPITRLPYGTEVTMVSRLQDSTWVSVSLADPNRAGAVVLGWIKTNLLDTRGKKISDLPVTYDIPPTPTPLPGKYGNTGVGQKGMDYTYTDEYGNIYPMSMECGGALPAGATCTCNCITVPRTCSCVGDNGGGPCSCNVIHYWYPN